MDNKKPKLYHSHIDEEKKLMKFFQNYNIELISKFSWEEYVADTYESFFCRESLRSLFNRFTSVFTYEFKIIYNGLIAFIRLLLIGYSETRRHYIIKNFRKYWPERKLYIPPDYREAEEYKYFINRQIGYAQDFAERKPFSKLSFFQTAIAIISEIIYLAIMISIIILAYNVIVV